MYVCMYIYGKIKKGHQKFSALKSKIFPKKGHLKILSAKDFVRPPKLGAKSPPMPAVTLF